MKERPILFSAPMVRALLNGTKTQTRRVVKGAPDDWAPMQPQRFAPTVFDRHGNEDAGPWTFGAGNEDGDCWITCPYGQPGDRIWVREAWAWSGDGAVPAADRVRKGEVWFRADTERSSPAIRWRPSIHMPRWASRITLEVTGVRVERLQAISEKDAWAEGCEGYDDDMTGGKSGYREYCELWEQINGPGSWDANPWVWVIEFKRVTP
ncbi:MAG TPA: hypothetical protein PLL92_08630 [Alicycliphilus sp.]|nr:hypothetical protein [Alicycliphilus sp.]